MEAVERGVAAADMGDDSGRAEHARVVGAAYFGRDDDGVAGAGFQPTSDDPFRYAIFAANIVLEAIGHFRDVEQVDAGVVRSVHQPEGGRVDQRSAYGHGAEADGGHAQPAASEPAVFHSR